MLEEAEANLKIDNKDWHFRRGRQQIESCASRLRKFIEKHQQRIMKATVSLGMSGEFQQEMDKDELDKFVNT